MAKAPSSHTLIKRIKNCSGFLNKYKQNERPYIFEELAVQGLARLLHLPYFDSADDDTSLLFRATWNGSRKLNQKALSGGPDGIIRAYDFLLVIEATLRTGSNQWTKEFGECLRHAKEVSLSTQFSPNQVFTLLITEKIHEDTFHCLKTSNANKQNLFKMVVRNRIIWDYFRNFFFGLHHKTYRS